MKQFIKCYGSSADESNWIKTKIRSARKGATVPRNKMRCREFVGFIRAYRDGELSGADRQSFLEHSGGCARCADYLKGYELTVSAAERSGDDSIDGSETMMAESLVRKIMERTLK